MDSGCDYTVVDSLAAAESWVTTYLYELERDGANYIQIVDADNPDNVIFYENVKWVDGKSNIAEIAERIAALAEGAY
ncbi:MAG: hypothetical protein J6N15_00160 [Ruminiclostridium sp.]|nr:hypothetical protein [Ruminiclostridium sp.]